FDLAIAAAEREVKAGVLKPAMLVELYRRRAVLHLQRSQRVAAAQDLAAATQLREAAVRDLTGAAQLAGNDLAARARAEADRGRVLHLLERSDEALAAYEKALQADPGRVDVHLWRGQVLLVQGKY